MICGVFCRDTPFIRNPFQPPNDSYVCKLCVRKNDAHIKKRIRICAIHCSMFEFAWLENVTPPQFHVYNSINIYHHSKLQEMHGTTLIVATKKISIVSA